VTRQTEQFRYPVFLALLDKEDGQVDQDFQMRFKLGSRDMKQSTWFSLATGMLVVATLACGGSQLEPASAPQPTTVPPTTAPTTASPTSVPTVVSTVTLEIINDSGTDIWYVYLSPSTSDQWGNDRLGDDFIADGDSFTLTDIPFGTYDVRAETSDHVEIAIWFNQPLDGPMTWEVWGGDGSGWIPRVDQWAFSATASSEYGNPDWAAIQATGAPDTPECGDYQTAWASSASDGVDWLELSYEFPVVPGRINIYESNSPGFIVQVEVIDEGGQYYTVWEGEPAPVDECPRVLSIPVTGIDFPVVGVRIHLDQSEGGNWNEIDAVELVGD